MEQYVTLNGKQYPRCQANRKERPIKQCGRLAVAGMDFCIHHNQTQAQMMGNLQRCIDDGSTLTEWKESHMAIVRWNQIVRQFMQQTGVLKKGGR